MQLEDRIAAAMRSEMEPVGPWAPDLDAIRRSARSQARRRAAVVVSCVAAAVVVVMMAADVGARLVDRSVPPVDQPDDKNRTDVVTIPRVRDERVVVTPTVRSAVPPGPRLAESMSSGDASYDRSGELSAELEGGKSYAWEASCDGAPEAFLVTAIEPNDTFFDSARCDGQSLSHLFAHEVDPPGSTLRAFVTEEDPAAYRRCYNGRGGAACHLPNPTDPGARFGLKVYVEEQGPVAVRMPGLELPTRTAWRGTSYSLATVAAGASGAPELTFRVDGAKSERIAQATHRFTRAFQRCLATGDFLECSPTVELLVDGRPVEDQREGPFGGRAGWGPLAAGDEHVITFRVVEGDARHVDLVVKVYEED